jgi:hypothetical protein
MSLVKFSELVLVAERGRLGLSVYLGETELLGRTVLAPAS